MIHPSTRLEYISRLKGYGVIATQFIPKGTVTWVQDKLDREFTPDEFDALGSVYTELADTYTFRNQWGNHILCWDHGKYVNHSFNSNCLSTPYNFEIAIRDILPGEELTDDYGYLNLLEPFEPMDEGHERKIVYPDDPLRMYRQWDLDLSQAFALIPQVEQKLAPFFSEEIQIKIHRILNGEDALDSTLECYFDPYKATAS
ncbi:MAG: SET domain-containing protein-lysine N-methyltransferase [Bacteroidetes bacterium]|nr:MAG: SET domain-containing protein-lysine N-methyltransferase [Bacteroidota bacterium]